MLSEWKPIETAPKDESDIILFQGRRVTFGSWDPRCGAEGDWIVWDRDDYAPPTHWMPLPEPPDA